MEPAGPTRAARLVRRRAAAAARAAGRAPKAPACYGILRGDTEGMMLRFVAGRPVGQVTEGLLAWACAPLAAEGERALPLARGDARWHVSARARARIKAHDRRAKAEGGVRVVACGPPVKAPWLNAIEPKWAHGRRAIAEPGRKSTGDEVVERACNYHGCDRLDPTSQDVV